MITDIHINNFRGLRSAAITGLQGRLFVTGLNGAGKTSLLGAVQVALTGQCHDQNGRRIQNPSLIGSEGREASVVLGLELPDGPAELAVTITAKQQTVRVTRDARDLIAGRPDEVRAALWKRLGGDAALADAGVHSRQYVLGDAILAHIAKLSGGIDAELLARLCGDNAEWLLNFAAARRLSLETPEALAKLGQAAYDARTEVNRNIKALAARIEAKPVEAPVHPATGKPFTADDLPALRKNLAELRQERDAAQRQLGAASGTHTQAEIDAGIQACQDGLAALVEPEIAVDALLAERDRMSKIHGQEKQIAARIHEEIQRVEKQIAAIRQQGAACPTCKRAYKKGDTEKAIAELEAKLVPLRAEYAEKAPYVQSLLDSLGPIDERIRAVRSDWDGYNAEKRRLEARLDAFQKCAPRQDTAAIEAEIASLDRRIQACESAIQALNECAALDGLRADLAAANGEAERLNWAVAAFRDGDITNQLTGAGQEVFIERMNERLAEFGISLGIRGGGADAVIVYRRRGVERVLAEASDGELLLCQLAVATTFGQGVTVLDGIDALDGEWRRAALEWLRDMQGSCVLGGAWGLAGQVPGQAIAQYLQPAAVVWVENGVASAVEAGEYAEAA